MWLWPTINENPLKILSCFLERCIKCRHWAFSGICCLAGQRENREQRVVASFIPNSQTTATEERRIAHWQGCLWDALYFSLLQKHLSRYVFHMESEFLLVCERLAKHLYGESHKSAPILWKITWVCRLADGIIYRICCYSSLRNRHWGCLALYTRPYLLPREL